MTSGSSVSTCIALASAHFGRNLGRPPVGAAGNGESNPRARSTRNGPQHSSRRPTSERPRRPGDYDVNGWPHLIFSPERLSPAGVERDFRAKVARRGTSRVGGHGGARSRSVTLAPGPSSRRAHGRAAHSGLSPRSGGPCSYSDYSLAVKDLQLLLDAVEILALVLVERRDRGLPA